MESVKSVTVISNTVWLLSVVAVKLKLPPIVWPATVTAAYRSGHRAAENVLGRTLPFD